ncbi:MAG: DNA cytosine methyltransferase [Cyanobacteriota bacterium]|nr:DNA cytosine methyltransferase [Cyanobacteriota bacterium]
MLTDSFSNPSPYQQHPSNLIDSDCTKAHSNAPKLKALSFFSGCMGLDLGLEQEGIETLLACEIDKAARKTIQLNKPELPLIEDYLGINLRQLY